MGLLGLLFGTIAVMDAMNSPSQNRGQGIIPAEDDEALYDDGYPDDYVGDGLDGTDDYVGDGLDGPDDGEYDDYWE